LGNYRIWGKKIVFILKKALQRGISAEGFDHNKPPPSLIWKHELFDLIAIFTLNPLIKSFSSKF